MSRTLGNAFPLQMLNTKEASEIKDFESVVGHPDTAQVLSTILKQEVVFNRTSVRLEKGDILFVAQITGGRLPEGTTTLPEGFTLDFLKVELV